ncbi:MAG: addiction module toxin RelE [Boseongicola sp. SB0675_bin_26]|nr:type II toxin-antitoxin system RelE/ParE family toxin [Boseongicola sp.]MYH59691.1 addiction module toxin RelE [Boseongicola sp. SB0675_bin_26]
MDWPIDLHEDFALELEACADSVKVEIMAIAEILKEEGPTLGRPHVDTLKGSRHSNMKELRCRGDCKTWRVAFAFTPERTALLLVAGNKSGMKSTRFYRRLIETADDRLDRFLEEETDKTATSTESG